MKNTHSGYDTQTGSMGITRRHLMKSAVAAGVTLPVLGSSSASAAPRRGLLRQDAEKPASLNMLYATVEADVEAIKLAIPDFKTETGIDIVLDSQPYDALQQKGLRRARRRQSLLRRHHRRHPVDSRAHR